MSKIKNGGLNQYGAEGFAQQQFGRADVEGVKYSLQVEWHKSDVIAASMRLQEMKTTLPTRNYSKMIQRKNQHHSTRRMQDLRLLDA